jgi:hypothetical protein
MNPNGMTETAQVMWLLLGATLLIAIGGILVLVRRRHLRGKYALLWLAVGLALIPLAVVPRLADRISFRMGVYYPPIVVVLAAVGLLTLLAMHYSWELSRLEERSRTLAEEAALLRSELERLEARFNERGRSDLDGTAVDGSDQEAAEPGGDHV